MVYAVIFQNAGYIPYSLLHDIYGTLISSDEDAIDIHDLSLYYTPPGGVRSRSSIIKNLYTLSLYNWPP